MVSPELIVGSAVSLSMELLKTGPLKDASDGKQRAVLGLLCLGGALGYGAWTGGLTVASLVTLNGSAEVLYTAGMVAAGAIVTWVGFLRDGRSQPPTAP